MYVGQIQILDDHIANQIAAGEVVERPASVVKELVENAVDAGAKKIEVTTEEGGLQLIRVTDNGMGMEPDDCETAFYRHATSKLSSSRDLFQIRTLGFRGEALPSIASVAKVELISAHGEHNLGRTVVIEGGSLKQNEETTAPLGTDIQVRELFYNTPARLKYMKTIQTELGHISDVMYRQALAHPNIAFTLKHNGNSLLQSPGNGDLLQVIASIYGTQSAKSMIRIEAENLDYRIEGYIARPDVTRSNRSAISTIVNGRYIRSAGLQAAMLRAYHTLLPINRYPLAVLQLSMHPSLVDVNVHPAKLEVRFSKEQELYSFLEESIRGALAEQVLIPHVVKQSATRGNSTSLIQEQFHFNNGGTPQENVGSSILSVPIVTQDHIREDNGAKYRPEAKDKTKHDSNLSHLKLTQTNESMVTNENTETNENNKSNNSLGSQHIPSVDPAGMPAEQIPNTTTLLRTSHTAASNQGERRTEPTAEQDNQQDKGYESILRNANPARPPSLAAQGSAMYSNLRSIPNPVIPAETLYGAAGQQAQLPAFPELYYVGQHHGTYLIAQNQESLFLIDQHAAHERINYEYYYEKFGNPADASQELLFPITLEFTSADAEKLKTRLNWFETAGVILEHFGGGTFRVVSHPYWFPEGDEASIVEEMADWVLSERAIDLAKLRERSSILCSCKASIKANQKLTSEEATTLLQRLSASKQPYTCPHGRPIVVSFSTYDLEKMFKRVM
ncbi:DNA mismatch repair protein MutL [Paenibacillus shirakamiensis]|uniref:DNA mismatch repair protein MutL n=1 Tax=Paenibacillus shirakamiensis TaxID=1265935 RepID=A0ABS4JD96_9BACL|nr:DNA mismatch repair endonuclease MutL [Paenibacillus shirakamiensis]MBP1999686.1 DNA mismatch repair protein MutL [Paenibacillus shirakamiensis]